MLAGVAARGAAMTPTAMSSTHSSSVGTASPRSPSNPKPARKRNRVPLSCGPCRHRKLKCNRTNPCDNCVRRGEAASCTYAAPGTRRKIIASQGASSSDKMQERIDRLEALVLSLMTNGARPAGRKAAAAALSASVGSRPLTSSRVSEEEDDDMRIEESDGEESDLDQVADSFGVMRVDADKSAYYGNSHWATIINDIAEVKAYFAEHKKQIDEQAQRLAATEQDQGKDCSRGPMLLFGTKAHADRADILAALPPRYTVDKLVSRHFNNADPILNIIHRQTFFKEYEAHWVDPLKTAIIWIGQLFAIITLAMQSYHRDDDEPPEYKGRSMQLANVYRKWTAECVADADFSKPVEAMIETMILHLYGEATRNKGFEVGVWVILGMIVRLAMRLGYHRDPRPYPNITPFRGEMRRRVWAFLRQMDILISHSMGLPGMIHAVDSDAELPSNIYDDEFSEESTKLPPSRPLSEPTPISYMITKARSAYKFGDIVEGLKVIGPKDYDRVMEFSNALQELHDNVPAHLRLRPLEEMELDPTQLIMQRFGLDLLFRKSQCVLHRRFLARAHVNPRFAHSRAVCVEAAMVMLSHQNTVFSECQPDGLLRSHRWFYFALTSHDFMLAAMIICLDLYYAAEATAPPGRASAPKVDNRGAEGEAKMIRALETSRRIWESLQDMSVEAYKAFCTLTVMIERSKTLLTKNTPASPAEQLQPISLAYPGISPKPATVTPFAEQNVRRDLAQPEEHSAAVTLGLLSTGGVRPKPGPTVDHTIPTTPTVNLNMTEAGSAQSPAYHMETSPTNPISPRSPFHSLTAMELPANLDWDTWDSYVQSSSFDPEAQIWPGSMDITGMLHEGVDAADDAMAGLVSFQPGQTDSLHHQQRQLQPQSQQQHQQEQPGIVLIDATAYTGSGGVFMGVSTPPGGTGI